MHRKLLVLVFIGGVNLFAQQSLHLSVGDPARKNKEARLVLDAVTATATGDLLTPAETVTRLGDTRLMFIGESHTSIDFHRAQLRVIEELARSGKKVMIGLEMYPRTEQHYLDEWHGGLLTENGFVQLSEWYRNWGYHWNYYRDIFVFARDHHMPMFALNAPREVVSAVTRKGLANLTPEERAQIAPKIDTSSEEHFTLFKAFFEEESGMHSKMSDSQARSMYASQCTWDATMGFNAVTALKEHGDQNTVMVVLIGSGHVAYGLGIQRQSAQWFEEKMASIIPIEVVDDKDRPIQNVQASYADYIWGLPPEKDSMYPDLGIATVDAAAGNPHRKVMSVSKNTPGSLAGVVVGDVLVAMDGVALTDREDLNRLMAGKRWGDSAALTVQRAEKQLHLTVYFRRSGPAPKPPTQ